MANTIIANTDTAQKSLYIGIMSGTSADGIDLALIDFSTGKVNLVASYYQAYSDDTYQKITTLYQPSTNEIDHAFALSVELANLFAQAIQAFLTQQNLTASNIIAIGNHGQTIRHRPTITSDIAAPFTLQIGCNQTLATLTNIRVIGDFRTKDMVLGGQGAPLVPAFHNALFPNEQQDVFIVNIGGIANITYLPIDKTQSVLGFDTGPGNALIDAWFNTHCEGRFDNDGKWAQSGTINTALLAHFMDDPYFVLSAPKSTGREYFNDAWVNQQLESFSSTFAQKQPLKTEDIQATLTALTAQTIAVQISSLSTKANVYLCGGGTLNTYLFTLIKQNLKSFNVTKTNTINIDSDALEASAFAWFAYAFDKKITGNIPAVTGASKETVLGIEFLP